MIHVTLAGAGQVTQPKELDGPADDPVALMAKAAIRAAEAAGGRGVLGHVDGLMVVWPLSAYLPDAPARLADTLGMSPTFKEISGLGGHSPQFLVNRAASMIARGAAQAILVAGGECFYPRDPAAARGEMTIVQGIPADYTGDDLVGATPYEQRHGLSMPIHGFPLFETALWGESGLARDAYLAQVGALWSGFSAIAAGHPQAWTRTPLSAAEIVTPSPANRPIAFPYTKRMTSLVMVDMAAAVLVTSEAFAARHLPHGRRVYFRGGGFAIDRQRFLVQKTDFVSSPPLALAARKAVARSGIGLDAIECFDLYSCFPSAIGVARRVLGLAPDDPRPLTLTGGLGFFGGPGNNFALHSIATLASAIAAGERHNGLTSALGWFMHKQAIGIYSAEPGDADLSTHAPEDEAAPLTDNVAVAIDEQPQGIGTIETYTVLYGRDHAPSRAIVYGSTGQGQRFVAGLPGDDPGIDWLIDTCRVGTDVRVHHDAASGINRIAP